MLLPTDSSPDRPASIKEIARQSYMPLPAYHVPAERLEEPKEILATPLRAGERQGDRRPPQEEIRVGAGRCWACCRPPESAAEARQPCCRPGSGVRLATRVHQPHQFEGTQGQRPSNLLKRGGNGRHDRHGGRGGPLDIRNGQGAAVEPRRFSVVQWPTGAQPMEPKTVRKLEKELYKAIADVICRLGLKKLPLLPSHRTMEMMAKAATAVYEGAVEEHERRDG